MWIYCIWTRKKVRERDEKSKTVKRRENWECRDFKIKKLSVTKRNKATEISMLKDKIIKSFRECVVFEYEEAIGECVCDGSR